jgi:hypothetical protein
VPYFFSLFFSSSGQRKKATAILASSLPASNIYSVKTFEGCCMPDTGHERGNTFNRTFIISMVIAAIGASIIIGLLYGCMRQANPKLPRQKQSTGIVLFLSGALLAPPYSAATP